MFSSNFVVVELDKENEPISKYLACDANGKLTKVKPAKSCHRRIAIKAFGQQHYLNTDGGGKDPELKPTTRLDLSVVEKLGYEVVVVDYRHPFFERKEYRHEFMENLVRNIKDKAKVKDAYVRIR